MLRAFSELQHYTVQATDGPVGRLEDIQFDDVRWVVRHLVVGVPGWLSERRFLMPPAAVQSVDAGARTCALRLTRSGVQEEAGAGTAPPVSRQQHITLYDSKGLPQVSAGPDPHLRSAQAIIGYVVLALDEEAGRIRDLLVEDGTWAVRYLVIGPTEPGRQALIGPD
jgi:sporulation protein YlmC with PRC-barrel domain